MNLQINVEVKSLPLFVRYTRKMQPSAGYGPIEINVTTVEELCSHTHVRWGLTNFCDTEFSPFGKGWDFEW